MNIAISNIQVRLHTDLATVSWVLNAYNLGFGVLLITMGRLADQFGRKRVYMFGMAIFSLGSLLCALSPSIGWLIGFRILQSIGAAALNPISLAIITHLFPSEKRGAAIGIWGAVTATAAALGPVLGGFLVQNFEWRWIFLVNLPFCVVGLIMVALLVPENKDPHASHHLDIAGLITITITLLCLVLAIIQGNEWGWSSPQILGLLTGSLIALCLFVRIERHQPEPLVDFSLFRIHSFVGTNITMFLLGIAVQGVFLILILYFIDTLGYDPLHAAYAIAPSPLAEILAATVASRLSHYISPKITGCIGILILGIGLALLYTLPLDASFMDTTWRAALLGIGIGLSLSSFPAIALSEVPLSKVGVGSGVFDTFRQIGYTLGVAILVSLLVSQSYHNTALAQQKAIITVQSDSKLPAQTRNELVTELHSSAGSSQQGIESSLTMVAKKLPAEEGLQTELNTLKQQLARDFKSATAEAFKTTWLVALIASGLALIAALVIRVPFYRKQ